MRIISGKYRGKTIIAPGNLPARPTTDFAKEGLFNILNNRLFFEETKALDLFAGTGNITYELVSRGCIDVIAVEGHAASSRFIKQTADMLAPKTVRVLHMDVFRFLKACNEKFDLIFADPPFEMPEIEKVVEMVFANNLLKEDGILVLEHSDKTDFSSHPAFEAKRHYGKVNFSLYSQEKYSAK